MNERHQDSDAMSSENEHSEKSRAYSFLRQRLYEEDVSHSPMDDIFVALIVAILIITMIILARRNSEHLSPFDDSVVKIGRSRDEFSNASSVANVSIPAIDVADVINPQLDVDADAAGVHAPSEESVLEHEYQREFVRPIAPPVHVAPIALTYDAAVAQRAILTMRDKRIADAISMRTVDHWRPIFEEELNRCENRDWWDDIDYPMNDPGLVDGATYDL